MGCNEPKVNKTDNCTSNLDSICSSKKVQLDIHDSSKERFIHRILFNSFNYFKDLNEFRQISYTIIVYWYSHIKASKFRGSV